MVKPQKKSTPKGMIDVGHKEATRRYARAQATLVMAPESLKALVNGECPKGNVFEAAKIAGIIAAKETPRIIPMCHPLPLNHANVVFDVDEKKKVIHVTAEVSCLGRTGVEMEALTAASVAALTIYDMMKWSDPAMVIKETRLLEKTGGQSGDFKSVPR